MHCIITSACSFHSTRSLTEIIQFCFFFSVTCNWITALTFVHTSLTIKLTKIHWTVCTGTCTVQPPKSNHPLKCLPTCSWSLTRGSCLRELRPYTCNWFKILPHYHMVTVETPCFVTMLYSCKKSINQKNSCTSLLTNFCLLYNLIWL